MRHGIVTGAIQRIGASAVAIVILSMPLARPDYRKLIAEGDALFTAIATHPARAKEALAKYRAALKLKPEDYEAMVKTSATLYYVGLDTAKRSEQAQIFQEGKKLAQRAMEIFPEGVHAHFWLGINTAKYGEAKGVLNSLFLVGTVKSEMETVIRIEPAYSKASAYTVLGRLYYLVPGILGGSIQKSREMLEEGHRLAPDNTTTMLFLAEAYWELKLPDRAIALLQELIALRPGQETYREFYLDKREAHQLLAEYTEKVS